MVNCTHREATSGSLQNVNGLKSYNLFSRVPPPTKHLDNSASVPTNRGNISFNLWHL